jgi:hypothetical protein
MKAEPSALGEAIKCQSEKPFPLKITAIIKLNNDTTWHGSDDWNFWLRDTSANWMKFKSHECIFG